MAWIAMRTDLADDPAVISMAATLGLDEFGVIGRLHRVWSWADTQTIDGHVSVTQVLRSARNSGETARVLFAWIDRHVQTEGFAAAMEAVGWLQPADDGIVFPNFSRWNSQTARGRILAAKRMAEMRKKPGGDVTPVLRSARNTSDGRSVTDASPTQHNTTEESRGMNSPTTPSCSEIVFDDSKLTAPAARDPDGEAVLTYPCTGQPREWVLTAAQLHEWEELYEALDLLAECRKALAWVRASPRNRKTAKGMKRFLVSWFSRANDSGRGRKPRTQKPSRDESIARVASSMGLDEETQP